MLCLGQTEWRIKTQASHTVIDFRSNRAQTVFLKELFRTEDMCVIVFVLDALIEFDVCGDALEMVSGGVLFILAMIDFW